MKTIAKTTVPNIKPTTTRKPEGRPKVRLGTLQGIVYMSDTLFDDDLK